ncbi:MAG: hypothetical protein CMO74_11380 [Verrucomicrobiales bacterium]|nr:hypothetical protein [Verrucomicrobiales bacterium]|tara:strand:+ start:19142 stop:19672 length:531 start_codon:yes stop_codon:yes gene_type:complete
MRTMFNKTIIQILAAAALIAHTASAAERPVLAVLLGEGDAMRVEWETQEGARYQVQASRDKTSWKNVGAQMIGEGRPLTVPVSISGGLPHLRIRRVDDGADLPKPRAEITRRGREYRLRWTTVKGGWYQVQGSVDEMAWANMGDVRRGSGQMDFVVVDVLGDIRFYRVLLVGRERE